MTTSTSVLGLIPLAVSLGEGSELRVPLAVTVIGGLITSTLLTLALVPVLYTLMTREKRPESIKVFSSSSHNRPDGDPFDSRFGVFVPATVTPETDAGIFFLNAGCERQLPFLLSRRGGAQHHPALGRNPEHSGQSGRHQLHVIGEQLQPATRVPAGHGYGSDVSGDTRPNRSSEKSVTH